jgi:ribosomal protein S18 acetylase RimI-like enzyme
MFAPTLIRAVEEASLNAWPPLRQMVWDGWLLRFADGYTRRANSVNPIYPGAGDPAKKIDRCEQIYNDRGLRPVFKITPLAQPAELDAILDARGYTHQAPTSVQVLALDQRRADGSGTVRVWRKASPEWLDNFAQFSHVDEGNLSTLAGILEHIPVPALFATLFEDSVPVACGLGVVEGSLIGLFDIVTSPSARGRGFGTRLLMNLLLQGRAHGAQMAYLQVMHENEPARRLYAKLGFEEIYSYWYRVQGKV